MPEEQHGPATGPMDAEIQDLLRSLNIEGFSKESQLHALPAGPIVAACPVKKRSLGQWLKSHQLSVFWIGGLLLAAKLSVFIFFFFHGVPESWVARTHQIIHWYEPVVQVGMTPLDPPVHALGVWGTNDLAFHHLPEGDLGAKSGADHLEILQAADGRKKALETIQRDVNDAIACCINTPDTASKEMLHRQLARFYIADHTLTGQLLPLIQTKRAAAPTADDHCQLEETLALCGLGRGLDGYGAEQQRLDEIKAKLAQLTTQVREEREVVALACALRRFHQLLDSVQKDPLLASFIDADAERNTGVSMCRHSVQEALQQTPASFFPRRCSDEERRSIAFLQGHFPDIEEAHWAKIDGLIGAPSHASLCALASDNNLLFQPFFSSTNLVLMAPDRFEPIEDSDEVVADTGL